jgi:signal transduction histidine kinase
MSKIRSSPLKSRSLAAWLATGIGIFVLAGSLAVLAFFQHLARVEEAVALESLGRTNALFLDQSRLPQSERMAEQLGRVMGASVTFRTADAGQQKPADGKARRTDHLIHVGFPLENGREVWFTRDSRQAGAMPVWKRLDTLLALGSFWVLALILALWLGRRVSRPLARLAAALPGIGADQPLTGLPTTGPLEILQLASALQETHGSLVEEREKRRHAERLALLGKMATSLAHEVRNPIAAIRLHAQLLERSGSPDDQQSAGLIVAEAGRIESLVSQWLFYAKPAPVARVPVAIDALAAEACRILQPQADHARVTIEQIVAPDSAAHPVSGDRTRLQQVLYNLLLNAIQSMPSGGTVVVRVLPGILEIDDQGGGFRDLALAHFGEPFFSEREGGMGLGLAVSKEIIESHGATLTAENLPGRGARLRILWPPTHAPSPCPTS